MLSYPCDFLRLADYLNGSKLVKHTPILSQTIINLSPIVA